MRIIRSKVVWFMYLKISSWCVSPVTTITEFSDFVIPKYSLDQNRSRYT